MSGVGRLGIKGVKDLKCSRVQSVRDRNRVPGGASWNMGPRAGGIGVWLGHLGSRDSITGTGVARA
jgi:hypothetical protein